jgi:hypothetical protein
MQKETLKLEFIENGRLNNGEMGGILGGESCRTYTPCPAGQQNKNMCSKYRDCSGFWDKLKCGTYHDFVIGLDYTFDEIEGAWYVE